MNPDRQQHNKHFTEIWICAILLTVGGFSMVTALNIANANLYKGFSEGVDLTPMKLQR